MNGAKEMHSKGGAALFMATRREEKQPMLKRMSWIKLVAAALLAVRWFVADWPLLGVGFANRYYPWEWVTVGGISGWLQFQAVTALAMTAYSVWAWGWAGVPKGAVAPPERNKDGSFYVPDERKRVALSESAPETNDAPGYEVPKIREIPRVQLSESNEDMLTAFGEAGDDDEDRGVEQDAWADDVGKDFLLREMAFHGVFGRVADQSPGQANLVHDLIADVDAGRAADALVLQAVADVDAGRAHLHAHRAVDAVTEAPGLRIGAGLA